MFALAPLAADLYAASPAVDPGIGFLQGASLVTMIQGLLLGATEARHHTFIVLTGVFKVARTLHEARDLLGLPMPEPLL